MVHEPRPNHCPEGPACTQGQDGETSKLHFSRGMVAPFAATPGPPAGASPPEATVESPSVTGNQLGSRSSAMGTTPRPGPRPEGLPLSYTFLQNWPFLNTLWVLLLWVRVTKPEKFSFQQVPPMSLSVSSHERPLAEGHPRAP